MVEKELPYYRRHYRRGGRCGSDSESQGQETTRGWAVTPSESAEDLYPFPFAPFYPLRHAYKEGLISKALYSI